MRKYYFILALLMLWSAGMSAQSSQPKGRFGLKGGVSYTHFSPSSELKKGLELTGIEIKSTPSLYFGITGIQPLNENVYLNSDLLLGYDSFTFNVPIQGSISPKLSIFNLKLPVSIMLQLDRIGLKGGVYGSVGKRSISVASQKVPLSDDRSIIWEAGLTLGAEVNFDNLFLELTVNPSLVNEPDDIDGHFTNIRFGVGYRF